MFIGATNVRSGLRECSTIAAVDRCPARVGMLTNCVSGRKIDGEHYWDGGYTGNPPLAPIYLRTGATDVIIIGINPLLRADVPRTAREIINRVDEISFNSAFITELAAIAFIEEIAKDRVRQMFMHIINDKALDTLGGSSKMNNKRTFLEHLRKIGWSAAEHWLKANLAFVGERSTVDLSDSFLCKMAYSKIPSAYGSGFKPQVKVSVPLTELRLPIV